MAGGLPKSPAEFHRIPNARLAIIGSMWHDECVGPMIEKARDLLLGLGVDEGDVSIHRLPGALELPYAAVSLFESDSELDAILAFGVVLKGITSHDETVVHGVGERLGQIGDRFGKPIINEVIGVKDIADAKKRSGDDILNKGVEAVFAVSEVIHWRRQLLKSLDS